MRYGAICIGLAGPLSLVPCHYPKYYSFLRKQIRLMRQQKWSKGKERSLEHPLGTILCTFLVHQTNWQAIYVICLGTDPQNIDTHNCPIYPYVYRQITSCLSRSQLLLYFLISVIQDFRDVLPLQYFIYAEADIGIKSTKNSIRRKYRFTILNFHYIFEKFKTLFKLENLFSNKIK